MTEDTSKARLAEIESRLKAYKPSTLFQVPYTDAGWLHTAMNDIDWLIERVRELEFDNATLWQEIKRYRKLLTSDKL